MSNRIISTYRAGAVDTRSWKSRVRCLGGAVTDVDRVGFDTAGPAAGADVVGTAIAELDRGQVDETTAVRPRGDFKNEFLQAFVDGLRHRPETTNGTLTSDVLEHFIPGFRRTTTVERIKRAPWRS